MGWKFVYLILGMNQLLWYYADLEKQKCLEDSQSDSTELESEFLSHLGGRKSNKVKFLEILNGNLIKFSGSL